MGAYLRSLNPRLPRAVWVLQLGGLANSFGNGLATPFLLIYLHNVRGMSIGTAGLVLAAAAAAGLLSGPVAGATSDRIGPRATLVAALVLMSIGYGFLPLVRAPWHAFALMTLVGVGTGGFWPAQSVLTAGLTPRARTHAAFSMQRVMNNLGIGLGAGIGGLIATTTHPVSFDVLFLLDATTFLVFSGTQARAAGTGPGGRRRATGVRARPARPDLRLLSAVERDVHHARLRLRRAAGRLRKELRIRQ